MRRAETGRSGDSASEWLDDEFSWQRPPGIFVLIDVRGEVGAQIHHAQQRYDPRLAAFAPPHLTLVGSSGIGPIVSSTSVDELRDRLEPVARGTAPFTVEFGAPVRFMQTRIVVLPLDPHGPLRQLHERIGKSGLAFSRARHMFTPHATLSLYRTLSKEEERALLQFRAAGPMTIDHLRFSLTNEPHPPRHLLELPLGR